VVWSCISRAKAVRSDEEAKQPRPGLFLRSSACCVRVPSRRRVDFVGWLCIVHGNCRLFRTNVDLPAAVAEMHGLRKLEAVVIHGDKQCVIMFVERLH
jgi:hypothetical protein